jgi:RsiW-degrading membrane proteinase PrsW (M82 family)
MSEELIGSGKAMITKDSLLLLVTGFCCSIGVWFFWHYTGRYGELIFMMFIVIVQHLDNRRLKVRINNLENKLNHLQS